MCTPSGAGGLVNDSQTYPKFKILLFYNTNTYPPHSFFVTSRNPQLKNFPPSPLPSHVPTPPAAIHLNSYTNPNAEKVDYNHP